MKLTKISELLISFFIRNKCLKHDNSKQNIFKRLYNQMIINKKRNFINYDLVDDFALSWLYYMYH